jgi:hypothetical protein
MNHGLVVRLWSNNLSQSLKKHLLWKGVELSHPPLFTKKIPFEKEKENPNPLYFLKKFQLVILSI